MMIVIPIMKFIPLFTQASSTIPTHPITDNRSIKLCIIIMGYLRESVLSVLLSIASVFRVQGRFLIHLETMVADVSV